MNTFQQKEDEIELKLLECLDEEIEQSISSYLYHINFATFKRIFTRVRHAQTDGQTEKPKA